MAVFNAAKREIDIKIVYYGPALCGKTTNVQCVHKMLSPNQRGDIMSLATKDDRTLFFDFLPIELGDVKGFKTRFHVYTVPGQVYYALTRRAVLTGVDGVVFVADSQASKMEENIESLQDLNENLNYYKKDLSSIPFVMQYNKRDMDNILPVAELNQKINLDNVPYFASSAVDGTGVIETLTACCKLVLKQMDSSGGVKKRRRQAQDTAAAAAPASPPPAAPQRTAADFKPAPVMPSFDDDDGPVIKIIAEDDFSPPSEQPAPPSGLSFPGTDLPSGDHNNSARGAGSGIGSLDEMPMMDSGSFDPGLRDESPVADSEEEESVPSLDAFDSVSTTDSLSFDSSEPEINLDDAEYDMPAFDEAVKPSLDRDTASSMPAEQPQAPQSAGRVTPSSGSFAVADCGSPRKVSSTAVSLPVTLKNTQTGQTCTVTVTVAFDDITIS